MLSIKKINLKYGSSQILYNVSVEAKKGEITCMMGSNGVGKTSLLKFMSGIKNASSGSYYINNKNVFNLPSHSLAKLGVGYVPQGRFIFPLLTVKENLEVGYACLGKSDWFIPEEIFTLFPVLKNMLHRRGGDLSGGQQQQLAIARALITKPNILLMDEPTEGIQPSIIKQIGEVILYLKKEKNMMIFLVEQYFDFAFDISDYIYLMQRGKIIDKGKKNDLDRKVFMKKLSI